MLIPLGAGRTQLSPSGDTGGSHTVLDIGLGYRASGWGVSERMDYSLEDTLHIHCF